jgi:excisionase family DNA binding protein
MSDEKLTLTIAEAARLSGWPLDVVNGAVATGQLRAKVAPGRVRNRRILRADLDKWLEGMEDA